jgi:hypothetical protein
LVTILFLFSNTFTATPQNMSFKTIVRFISSHGRIDIFVNVSSIQTHTKRNKNSLFILRTITPLKGKLSETHTCEREWVIKLELAQQVEMFCNKGTSEFTQELWKASHLLLTLSIYWEADRTGQQFNYWEVVNSMIKFLTAHVYKTFVK